MQMSYIHTYILTSIPYNIQLRAPVALALPRSQRCNQIATNYDACIAVIHTYIIYLTYTTVFALTHKHTHIYTYMHTLTAVVLNLNFNYQGNTQGMQSQPGRHGLFKQHGDTHTNTYTHIHTYKHTYTYISHNSQV